MTDRLKWTSDLPAKPGWYWWISGSRRKIDHFELHPNGTDLVCYDRVFKEGLFSRPEHFPAKLWAGPIPEPEGEINGT